MGFKFDNEFDKFFKREQELAQELVQKHEYSMDTIGIYSVSSSDNAMSYSLGSLYNSVAPYGSIYLSIRATNNPFRVIEIESPFYSKTIKEINGSSSMVQYLKSYIESVESKINDGTIGQAMQDAHPSKWYSGSEEDHIAFAKQWLHDIRLNFSKLLEDMPELGIKLEEIGMSDPELAERKIEQQDKMLAELQKQLSDTRAERDAAQEANQRLQAQNESLKTQNESLKKRMVAAFTSLADSFKKKPTFGGHKHDDVQQGIKKAAEAAGLDMSTYQIHNPAAPTVPEDR